MSDNIDWGNLHDSTLKNISVNWHERICEMTLTLTSNPIRPAVINSVGLNKLILFNEAPWGQSSSINKADLTLKKDSQLYILQIEMQSGDTIVIEARSIIISDL